MDFNGGASVRPSPLVPDSPAVKRQKTYSGYNSTSTSANNTGAYNSDDDITSEIIPDTPGNGYQTQPTQILPHNRVSRSSSPIPPRTSVQVPASSPITTPQPERSAAPPQAAKPSLAGLMAPRGTNFRPPAGVVTDGPVYDLISSDEEDQPHADIQPTKFGSAKSSFNSTSGSRNGLNNNGTSSSDFRSIMERAKFDPYQSNGYGVVKKAQTQTLPSRAQHIMPPIYDRHVQRQIEQIKNVLTTCTDQKAYNALRQSNLNVNDAIDRLIAEGNPIVIDPEPVQMKHSLQDRVKSIAEKYGSFPSSQIQSSPAANVPIKPKKRLVQGRRNPDPSSPAAPAYSSPSKLDQVDVYDGYDSDSAVGSEEEEPDLEIEAEVLKYINKATAKDLIDTTAFPLADIEFLIAERPFKNLDTARSVRRTTTTKTGKKGKGASVGDKIVDKCVAMFTSFEAVTRLQTECAALGKPVAEEMAKWGIDVLGAKQVGELEMVSIDEASLLDSGLGTPIDSVASNDGGDDGPVKRQRKTNFLKQPETMKIDQEENPGEVFEMKDYQILGLNWLALMYRLKLSCMLADDMGLGKTCQVISFLTHLVETGRTGPHIVVCPASTLDNWCAEMHRISPKLNFMAYHAQKEKRGELQDIIKDSMVHGVAQEDRVHVVITTYDIARPKDDGKFLRSLNADVVVYDEGHVLKNPESQRYQNLIRISAKFRLLLTGTPLQNNLRELVAILAFILPDVFKGLTDDLEFIFKAKATTQDSDHAQLLSKQRIDRARSILTPFVLRRKKEQVLKHLPAKVRRTQHTTMTESQTEVYKGLRKIFNKAMEESKESRAGKSDKALKAATKVQTTSDSNNPLMQLRKAAIHPLLFRRHFDDEMIDEMAKILRKKNPEEFPMSQKYEYLTQEMMAMSDFVLHRWCMIYPVIKRYDIKDLAWLNSGKVAALVELLQTYKKNGDKALVFSQFSAVLDILEAVLNTIKVKFARIDGSTPVKDRQPLINDFNNMEELTVFLLTTKAGGTGINLTSANKVIIFDSSFNPQDDRQAENRAHRYGQTRDVEVVILASQNTIEEKILALGDSKLELDERVAEQAVEEMILKEDDAESATTAT